MFQMCKTRLSFNTEILLANFENPDKDNWKDYSYKVCYNLKLDGDEKYSTKRVISKILKLDENNQYDHAMTKPMPTGSIEKKVPSWREFNLLLEIVDLDDPIGHLFVVDIEKQKVLDANERSVYQLVGLYSKTDKGVSHSYHPTAKAHAALFW